MCGESTYWVIVSRSRRPGRSRVPDSWRADGVERFRKLSAEDARVEVRDSVYPRERLKWKASVLTDEDCKENVGGS